MLVQGLLYCGLCVMVDGSGASVMLMSVTHCYEDGVIRLLIGEYLPYSMSPRAKIGVFLKLRQASAFMCVAIMDSMIARINLVASTLARCDAGVWSWVSRVVYLGWCHELWPASRGMPGVMRPAFFDSETGEQCVLCWKKEYEDGSAKWVLAVSSTMRRD